VGDRNTPPHALEGHPIPETFIEPDYWHTMLCIVDSTTGKVHKTIATYENMNRPFYVAWGFSE
jgi:hypothetical protein